jgi:hypothetical protein
MPKLDSKYRTECALSIAVLGVIGSRLPVPCAPVLKTGPRISNPSQADQPRKLSFYSLKSPYIALSDDVRRCLETHRDLVLVLRLTVCQRCSRMAWSPVCARLSLSTLPLQRTTTKTLTRSSNTRDTPRSPLLFTPPPQFSSAFDTSRCVKSTATARLGAPPPLPSPSAKAGYAYAGPLYGSCISTRPMRLTVPSLNSSMLPARCLAPEETLSACAHVWLDESVYVLCRSFPERALVHIS